jgi:hypothetical protein
MSRRRVVRLLQLLTSPSEQFDGVRSSNEHTPRRGKNSTDGVYAPIPINLPDEHADEALAIRNKLLMYRFETLDTMAVDARLVNSAHSARLNQILVPLLSVVDDAELRDEIWNMAGELEQCLYRERASTMDAGVIEILTNCFAEDGRSYVTVAEVTEAFAGKFGADYERPITNRMIGGVIRKRLRLVVYKSHGIYVIPMSERPKVQQMAIRFGVVEQSGLGIAE